jgi:hypothetical protein
MDLVEKLRVEEHVDTGVPLILNSVVDDIALSPMAVAKAVNTLKK